MSFYDLLGVPPDADDETLQKAISQQAAQWSKRSSNAASVESRHQAERTLQSIQEARQVLLKPEKRAEYDQSLPAHGAASSGNRATGPVAPEDRIPCPFCLESIHRNAKKCRWCNEWLDAETKQEDTAPPPRRTPTSELKPIKAEIAVSKAVVPVATPVAATPVTASPSFNVARPIPVTPSSLVNTSNVERKSRGTAFVLCMFFGVLGLFYIRPSAGWWGIFWGVLLSGVSGGVLFFPIWFCCLFIGWSMASNHNKRLGFDH